MFCKKTMGLILTCILLLIAGCAQKNDVSSDNLVEPSANEIVVADQTTGDKQQGTRPEADASNNDANTATQDDNAVSTQTIQFVPVTTELPDNEEILALISADRYETFWPIEDNSFTIESLSIARTCTVSGDDIWNVLLQKAFTGAEVSSDQSNAERREVIFSLQGSAYQANIYDSGFVSISCSSGENFSSLTETILSAISEYLGMDYTQADSSERTEETRYGFSYHGVAVDTEEYMVLEAVYPGLSVSIADKNNIYITVPFSLVSEESSIRADSFFPTNMIQELVNANLTSASAGPAALVLDKINLVYYHAEDRSQLAPAWRLTGIQHMYVGNQRIVQMPVSILVDAQSGQIYW